MSQNRKHFLQYDNLVRTTEIVPRHFKKSWNQSVKVEGASIHLSQALVDVKGSKTIDMQNLLSRALLLLSYTLMSKGHILKAKIQGLKGEGLKWQGRLFLNTLCSPELSTCCDSFDIVWNCSNSQYISIYFYL